MLHILFCMPCFAITSRSLPYACCLNWACSVIKSRCVIPRVFFINASDLQTIRVLPENTFIVWSNCLYIRAFCRSPRFLLQIANCNFQLHSYKMGIKRIMLYIAFFIITWAFEPTKAMQIVYYHVENLKLNLPYFRLILIDHITIQK